MHRVKKNALFLLVVLRIWVCGTKLTVLDKTSNPQVCEHREIDFGMLAQFRAAVFECSHRKFEKVKNDKVLG
jgi:hypothetical protein